MEPTRLKRAASLDAFEKFGTVRLPSESEAPILTPSTRGAVHQWMFELQAAEELAKVGVAPRQRAMLSGPPGTGKTTLAHHVAARLGLPLIIIESTRLVEGYIGATGRNIGGLFDAARAMKGNVALFFDEIDSIAIQRGKAGGNDAERSNIVIALLQMLDRYDGTVFAATNRAEIIDPALWRRFEMQIEVGLPEEEEVAAIITRYAKPYVLDPSTLYVLVDALVGAAPALIKQVVEAVKRDLILAPRLKQEAGLTDNLTRLVASLRPAEDQQQPLLWSDTAAVLHHAAGLPWPPERAG